MRYSILFIILNLLQIQSLKAQGISAVVLDSQTRQPIPFATVQYAPGKGVITNEEGRFSLISGNGSDTLIISSLGYFTKSLMANELEKGQVYLMAENIQLNDVFLSDKQLSSEEILKKVKERVKENYNFDLTQKRFFFRESNVNNIKKFDLEVEKSTFPDLNQDLMNRIAANIPKVNDSYKEVLGDFYGNYDQQKIKIIKAANLYNPRSTGSLTELTGDLERIFQENVKPDSFLKIRTGILGVKVDAEEFAEGLRDEKEAAQPKEKTAEEKEKELADRQKYLKNGTNINIQNLLNTMFWNDDITMDFFDKSRKYKFEIEGFAQMDSSIVYIISFEPKRGADFKGRIYVNTQDYGVHRLDYQNVKPLSKLRLFGISSSDDVYRGKMIFSRDENGKYDLRYLEKEEGESFGINRPLTVVEKNNHVRGRRKQNELDMEIRINAGQLNKYQLVVYENEDLQQQEFDNIKEAASFEYETFKVYNPDFWNGYNIIEPNAAIKAFTTLD